MAAGHSRPLGGTPVSARRFKGRGDGPSEVASGPPGDRVSDAKWIVNQEYSVSNSPFLDREYTDGRGGKTGKCKTKNPADGSVSAFAATYFANGVFSYLLPAGLPSPVTTPQSRYSGTRLAGGACTNPNPVDDGGGLYPQQAARWCNRACLPRQISPPCSTDQGSPYASVTLYPLGWKSGALAPRVRCFGHVSEYTSNLA